MHVGRLLLLLLSMLVKRPGRTLQQRWKWSIVDWSSAVTVKMHSRGRAKRWTGMYAAVPCHGKRKYASIHMSLSQVRFVHDVPDHLCRSEGDTAVSRGDAEGPNLAIADMVRTQSGSLSPDYMTFDDSLDQLSRL